jgi:hypothetical protein
MHVQTEIDTNADDVKSDKLIRAWVVHVWKA